MPATESTQVRCTNTQKGTVWDCLASNLRPRCSRQHWLTSKQPALFKTPDQSAAGKLSGLLITLFRSAWSDVLFVWLSQSVVTSLTQRWRVCELLLQLAGLFQCLFALRWNRAASVKRVQRWFHPIESLCHSVHSFIATLTARAGGKGK